MRGRSPYLLQPLFVSTYRRALIELVPRADLPYFRHASYSITCSADPRHRARIKSACTTHVGHHIHLDSIRLSQHPIAIFCACLSQCSTDKTSSCLAETPLRGVSRRITPTARLPLLVLPADIPPDRARYTVPKNRQSSLFVSVSTSCSRHS